MTSVQQQGNQSLQTITPQIMPPTATPAQNSYCTPPAAQQAASPSYAGVNIQIYNPSVGIPNINPTGAMPQSQGLPGMAYPSNYYTQQYGIPQNIPPQGGIIAQGGQGGSATVYNYPNNAPANGFENGSGNGIAANSTGMEDGSNMKNLTASKDSANTNADSNTTSTTTNTITETTKTEEKKKTEKRKVVELSDEYIKNLENYLNSQDKEVRMMGAKEVVARLQEDDSRKDDPALTALINKMLQDPAQQVRVLALSMLDSRTCTGNDYTVNVLKKMQNSKEAYGQDAAQATNILLKMSGKVVEKEFEVSENSAKK